MNKNLYKWNQMNQNEQEWTKMNKNYCKITIQIRMNTNDNKQNNSSTNE